MAISNVLPNLLNIGLKKIKLYPAYKHNIYEHKIILYTLTTNRWSVLTLYSKGSLPSRLIAIVSRYLLLQLFDHLIIVETNSVIVVKKCLSTFIFWWWFISWRVVNSTYKSSYKSLSYSLEQEDKNMWDHNIFLNLSKWYVFCCLYKPIEIICYICFWRNCRIILYAGGDHKNLINVPTTYLKLL